MNAQSIISYNQNPIDILWNLFLKQPSDVKKEFKARLLTQDYEMAQNPEKEKFMGLLQQWRTNTAVLSLPRQITSDQAFLDIVAMGQKAVPYILEEIREKPSNLVWALNRIFNKKISQGNITIPQACELWIKELQ